MSEIETTMSGAMASTGVHTTSSARKRLAKRYASERRFRLYGFGAVMLSGLFLVLLTATIFVQGLPAFTYHHLSLPLQLTDDALSLKGARDDEAIRTADFDGLVKGALRDLFSSVTDRREKRALNGLLSSGAGIMVRNEVIDDPALLGAERTVGVGVSDTADLYLKGRVTDRSEIAVNGTISPVGTSGEIKLLSSANDFAPILAEIKSRLAEQAHELRNDISLRGRTVKSLTAQIETLDQRLADTGDADIKARLEQERNSKAAELAAANAQIAQMTGEAEILEKRANAVNEPEQAISSLPSYLIRINGGVVKATSVDDTGIDGVTLLPLESEAEAKAGDWSVIRVTVPEANRKISDQEIVWLDKLSEMGLIENRFNTQFLTTGASREAEMAGIWGAVVGSFFTMVVTLSLSFPLGVAAAIYLEEFAPKNRWTHLIEVNINNLAAVPSIVFGLLGLAVFLAVFGLPRSAPVVGGMVLALMTLPTIIIASRAALKAVPPSIREAALGIGASRIQAVFHHVLPLAMPGILTGTIIGMAQALGETAPLLMIGMVAFIVDVPATPFDPATVLPVQIYMWADFPEQAFQQKTAGAILVLLGFLVIMNAIAVVLRNQFERRW